MTLEDRILTIARALDIEDDVVAQMNMGSIDNDEIADTDEISALYGVTY